MLLLLRHYPLILTKDLTVSDLLINDHTASALERFMSSPSHALLLMGQKGDGLFYLAQHIQKLLQHKSHEARVFYELCPQEKPSITIEQVRELRSTFKHKMTHTNESIHTIIIVNSIENMQHEAQNALLKHLEEPPTGVLFIILCHDQSQMLQTILSRCVVVNVLPVTIQQAQEHFGLSISELAKPYAISSGAPSMLVHLINSSDHPILKDIEQAKIILSSPIYKRLCSVDAQFKTLEQAKNIIIGLEKVCRAGLKSGSKSQSWIHNNSVIQEAQKKLSAHVQAKLVIDELFITLK